MNDTRYATAVDVSLDHPAAIETVTELLKVQGFGVLTTIDVKATMKKKIDVDVEPHTILGACNPPLAYQAIQAEEGVGVLLPCNVVVRQVGDGVQRVFFTRPAGLFSLIDNDGIGPLADEVGARLEAVADALSKLT